MGGIPTNYHGEVLTVKDGDPDAVVPGLMAIGEAACVSVHGANRLGSNSLLDLVVFGRAAANRAAELLTPGESHKPAAADAGEEALARLDRLRHAKGGTATAAAAPRDAAHHAERLRGVPHQREARRGLREDGQGVRRPAPTSGSSDRSMIWNCDLVETLELENLIVQAHGHHPLGGQPHGKPRRACARGLSRARRRELDEAHGRLGGRGRQDRASTTGRCTCSR